MSFQILHPRYLTFDPGSKWNYSISIDILGRIIEVVSGLKLDDFLHDNIFKPLNMIDTDFYVPEDKHDRFVDCYRISFKKRE